MAQHLGIMFLPGLNQGFFDMDGRVLHRHRFEQELDIVEGVTAGERNCHLGYFGQSQRLK